MRRELLFLVAAVSWMSGCRRAPTVVGLSDASVASEASGRSIPETAQTGALANSDTAVDSGASDSGAATEPLPEGEIVVDYGPCFGACLEYTLKLRSNGAYDGAGLHRDVDAATTRVLFDLATEAFATKPRCSGGPTDVQMVTVRFTREKKSESVKYVARTSCSAKLSRLEAEMTKLRRAGDAGR